MKEERQLKITNARWARAFCSQSSTTARGFSDLLLENKQEYTKTSHPGCTPIKFEKTPVARGKWTVQGVRMNTSSLSHQDHIHLSSIAEDVCIWHFVSLRSFLQSVF